MHASASTITNSLCEQDETAWLEVMAELFRAGRVDELDYPILRSISQTWHDAIAARWRAGSLC